MDSHDRISERQLNVLCYASLLSPVIRLLPHASILLTGKAAWLSPVFAAGGGALWFLFIKAFFKNRSSGEGLMEMCRKYIGKPLTAVLMFFMAFWLVFYCGFLLRTAAERFLSAVYSNGNTPVFVIVMLIICMIAANGTVKSLARSSEVFALIINAIFILVVVFSFINIKTDYLLPVAVEDVPKIALGSLPIVNIMGIYAYTSFLFRYVEKTPHEGINAFRWMLYLSLFAFFIIFITIGSCSAELASNLQSPFFMMIRNITILGFIDRIEAVLIAIWVATDFLFLSFLYIIIGDIGKEFVHCKSRLPFVIPAGVLSAVCAFLMTNNAFEIRALSERLVPAVNMSFSFVLLPFIFLCGKIRKKMYTVRRSLIEKQ